MTRLVFKLDQKGWLKALGLHHAFVNLLAIATGHFIHPHVGAYMAVLMTGWYLQREWGGAVLPGSTFEYMDFITPALLSTGYLIAFL